MDPLVSRPADLRSVRAARTLTPDQKVMLSASRGHPFILAFDPAPRTEDALTEDLKGGQAARIDPDIQAYLDRVVVALEKELGAGLVGVYVHGSLAMGTFVPGRSDIDVLAVCGEALSSKHSRALGAALDAIPRPRSGGDLEFSLVTEAEARKPSVQPAFEVHVSTHEEVSVVDGHDRPGDEDLVIHFAMARARGRALLGPEPNDLFLEPDRPSLLRAFLSDLEWARRHGASGWEGHDMPELASIAYRVLNAARSGGT